jgi:general stress protein 26
MNTDEQRSYCLDVIRLSPACYLATVNGAGAPEIRAMLNLRNESLYPSLQKFFAGQEGEFTVFLGTNTSSEKTRQIRANPNASLYYCLPDKWRGVMLAGRLEIIDDRSVKQALWIPSWTMYYPQGPFDPDYTVLRLRPARVKAYGNLSTFTLTPEAV